MSTDWEKHFRQQVLINGYDDEDYQILNSLFSNLKDCIEETDEDGLLIGDDEMIDSFFYVIWYYLATSDYRMFQRIVTDMTAEAEEREKAHHQRKGYDNELLQEEPPAQTEEGEGQL